MRIVFKVVTMGLWSGHALLPQRWTEVIEVSIKLFYFTTIGGQCSECGLTLSHDVAREGNAVAGAGKSDVDINTQIGQERPKIRPSIKCVLICGENQEDLEWPHHKFPSPLCFRREGHPAKQNIHQAVVCLSQEEQAQSWRILESQASAPCQPMELFKQPITPSPKNHYPNFLLPQRLLPTPPAYSLCPQVQLHMALYGAVFSSGLWV